MQNRGKFFKLTNTKITRKSMLKKTLLSTLLLFSTVATASIHLNLNLALQTLVEEDVPVSLVFDGLDDLIFELVARTDNGQVVLQIQLFQQIGDDEFIEITD